MSSGSSGLSRATLLTLGLGAAATASLATFASPVHAQQTHGIVAPTIAVSAETVVADELVVDLRDDLSDSDVTALFGGLGVSFVRSALEGETRTEIAHTSDPAALAARLSGDPRVEGVEPLGIVKALYTPNDPMLKDQWHMTRVGAERAWNFGIGRGAVVAVVDTGIACETFGAFSKVSDLAGTACVTGWSAFDKSNHANDEHGHGTHVAGTIAQTTNNGKGAAGLAFGAKLMPVKVLDANGGGTNVGVADGIRWAADNGADVINLSLGGPLPSLVLQKAVDHARSKGVVVVAAAGNSGGRVGYPGACSGVIGVSATDDTDTIATFSSRGKAVDIAAPGVAVVQQTVCNGGREKCEKYAAFSGTSMASPHVAGAAALLVGAGVTDPDAIEQRLKETARPAKDGATTPELYGAGILDANAALMRTTLVQGFVRTVALGLLLGLAFFSARKKNANAQVLRADVLGPALLTGPGLFFLPFLLPRAFLPIELLSRPIPEWDLLVSSHVHAYLPLANALIPFGLLSIFFGVAKLRPALAGVSIGLGAYLASAAILGESAGPFGKVAMLAWTGANALGCLAIARINLAEEK
jgi:serine protease